MPANCGPFVRDRETLVRIGLRGGGCSPDRTCLNLSKFPENWENIGNFAPFGPCGGLIGEQFQKLAGKIPMHGNWEFILGK
jgi:hypothetical protein